MAVGSPADLRHEPGQLIAAGTEKGGQRAGVDVAKERTERLDEGPVRKAAGPERKAAPDQDPDARIAESVRPCRDQACLADPGLAGEDDGPRLPGGRTRVGPGEALEFRLASDEGPTTSSVHDPAMIGAPAAPPSRPAIDQLETQAHAVMPADSKRVRRRPRARHRRARVASPEQPMIPAISCGR